MGCILSKEVGQFVFILRILDKNKYLNILQQNLKKSATTMDVERTFKYYENNDPKHKARIVKKYLHDCPRWIEKTNIMHVTHNTVVINNKDTRYLIFRCYISTG